MGVDEIVHLLITGAWREAERYIPELEQKGHETVFLQWEQDRLPCAYEWVEGTICNGLFLHHPIESFPNLRFIQLTSAGYDRVDLDSVKERGIEIHNAKGVYSIPMAEFAVSGVLQLYKQSLAFAENQKARCWEKCRGLRELYGKTVCIVGCGSVGTECAKRFRAFGCRVLGVNRTTRNDLNYERIVGMEQLSRVLAEADIVLLTLPLDESTVHLMNTERFAKLKNDAVLVNLSRGALIDTEAFLQAISSLGGAVLDVFEEEPLSADSPLWTLENVILTPHNSFVGEGNGARLHDCIIHNL